MHKVLILALFVLYSYSTNSQVNQHFPFKDISLSSEERVNDLINRMTLEEKIDLLAGYNDFYLHPCNRLGIPAFKLADGPLGVSSWGLWGKATAFPSSISIAASWDKNLASELGQMYANEFRARGIHFLLAPGVNMYRASKSGRNFEYYGEDPFLTSNIIVPFIKAVQNGGVIATVKHYAGNDQEFDRYNVSTEVSERALREIYLAPFKAAVKKAKVKAVMTGYNLVNGVYCTENKFLIDILKKEWGFDGILMSDWACTYSADNAANNGLDLEMGSKDWFNREKLLPLVKQGKVSENIINEKVKRIYKSCIDMGFFDRPQKTDTIPTYNPKANKLALKAAENGIVLLKNNGILPLLPRKAIAVIGPTANQSFINDRIFSTNNAVFGGGGSSRVNPWHVTTDLQGIEQEFPNTDVFYCEGISNQFIQRLFKNSAFQTHDGQTGLIGKYYSIAPTNESLAFEKTDKMINFEWWDTPNKDKNLGEDYKIIWDGFVNIEKDDSIRFFIKTQGACQLFVDDNLLIDGSNSQSNYENNKSIYASKGTTKHIRLVYWNQKSLPSEIKMGYCYDSDIDFSEAKRIAAKSDLVIFCAGFDSSIELEGRDRSFNLPYGQDLLIQELSRINPNLIVVIHAGGGINMSSWNNKVSAIIHAFYPGQQGGKALAHILSGFTNPSAKLPFTIEKRWEDSPAFGHYDETRKTRKIYYQEGIYMGYRGYEKKGATPLYPFGYGLSYTTFKYNNIKVNTINKKEGRVDVSVDITNIGNRYGSEIVQLYISDIKSKEERPLKELKGFEKVWLAPNETKTITISLSKEDFQYFNERKKEWIFEKGDFIIKLGSSSQDIKIEKAIRL